MKRKANISIELQGLKCDHQVWPWLWPWPWIFKVKYGISYISAKSGPIATKRKTNISIELQASNVTNGFDLDHNLDLWILKVKRDLDLWLHTWPWPWIFMVKFWYSCITVWEGQLTLHKGGGSRSFMTMTMTIWWPRSGVWIYQIVTGVTSVVGVPSTHIVVADSCWSILPIFSVILHQDLDNHGNIPQAVKQQWTEFMPFRNINVTLTNLTNCNIPLTEWTYEYMSACRRLIELLQIHTDQFYPYFQESFIWTWTVMSLKQ